jgi:hypothetical protein
VQLQRIRLNSGGYDSSGSYYGLGLPLYQWAISGERDDGTKIYHIGNLRAGTRDKAKQYVRDLITQEYGTGLEIRFYK